MSAVYDTGTISVTNGSAVVTGAGTAWVGVLRAGWLIHLPSGEEGVVDQVVSATELLINRAYTGSTQTGQDYWAISTGGVGASLAAEIAARNADVQAMLDGPGSGRFGDGTAALPGIAFEADQDSGLRRVSSNTVALTTGGVDRMIVGPDTMTGPVIQSSLTDTTAGKIMTVGAFGLGGAAPSTDGSENALDNLPPVNGRWRVLTAQVATVNGPLGAKGGVVDHQALSAINQFQTFSEVVTPFRQWVRGLDNFGWTPWVLVTPERGSNSNGDFVRFADGLQICTRRVTETVTTSPIGNVHRALLGAWIFPAAFAAEPVCFLNAQLITSISVTAANATTTQLTERAVFTAIPVADWTVEISSLAIGKWK